MLKIGEKAYRQYCDIVYEPGCSFESESKSPLIYCDSRDLYRFVLDRSAIKGKYRLLTHGSDHAITKESFFKMDCPEMEMWYGINVLHTDPKLRAIPIGICDRKSVMCASYERLDRASKGKKNGKVYVNFRIGTNRRERSKFYEMGLDPEVFTVHDPSKYDGIDEYVQNLSEHSYCLCPPGRGIDTFRFWEALYVGTMPIVFNDYYDRHFPLVPHKTVKDIKEVPAVKMEQAPESQFGVEAHILR